MSPVRLLARRTAHISLALAVFALAACSEGPDIDATIDARIQLALEARPTVTPQPSPTPQPTPTSPPAPTPQAIPTALPTATPAPTVTPQPTSTAAPEPTPIPTATPPPTPTSTSPLPPTPTAIPVPNDLYADLRLSVVKIGNGGNVGSGWAIEEGWIITNEHVVSSASTVSIEVPLAEGGVRTLTGTVRGVDSRRDLAAIEVDHRAPILPRRVVVATDAGTPIMQFGYSVLSDGGFPVVHTGVITTVIRHLGNVLDNGPQRADEGGDTAGVGVVVFDADADPGDSGGPVVDMQGNVVGITFGSVISTNSGKRVIGQQQATGVESIDRVWNQLKNGVNTTPL